jgi:hypothetical protein
MMKVEKTGGGNIPHEILVQASTESMQEKKEIDINSLDPNEVLDDQEKQDFSEVMEIKPEELNGYLTEDGKLKESTIDAMKNSAHDGKLRTGSGDDVKRRLDFQKEGIKYQDDPEQGLKLDIHSLDPNKSYSKETQASLMGFVNNLSGTDINKRIEFGEDGKIKNYDKFIKEAEKAYGEDTMLNKQEAFNMGVLVNGEYQPKPADE